MRYQAVNALPLRNFVSIASGFLLFRGGCAQTLLSVRLYALSGSERTSAPELCQYSIGFSSVLRRMCSDAFMRSPAVNALFRSGILSVSPRAFFCFASDALRRFYAFSGSERAVPLRNFVSIASGFLLFRVGCAQTLLCVLRQWPRCSAQEFCQYRLELSSVSRRICSD